MVHFSPMPTSVHTAALDTPIGTVEVLGSEKGVAQITFADPSYTPINPLTHHPVITSAAQQLQEYFDGKRRVFDSVALHYPETDFQRDVWNALMEVPYGEVVTYGELAAMAGHKGAARAVGTAMNVNPLPIIIPCHRVLPANKTLGEYAFGAERKLWLLQHERGVRGQR